MDSPYPRSSSLWCCPNSACIASGNQKVGLRRPLLELPVDPNHVRLVCPFCDVHVTQCDSCCSLIVDKDVLDDCGAFQICRKCGFPNIVDDKLRVEVLGLPRNQPLPYHTARVIQRSIDPDFYKAYKLQELASIESVSADTSAEYCVVSSSPSNMAPREVATTSSSDYRPHQPRERHLENAKGSNCKKRPREEGSGDDCEEDAGLPKNKKMSTTLENLANGDIPVSASESREDVKNGHVTLAKWKRHLTVPLPSMVQFLRAQTRVISVKMCADHDAKVWQSMQYQERATQFLPIHATVLRAIFSNPELNPQFLNHRASNSSSDAGDLQGDGRMADDANAAFFQRLEQFMEARPTLLNFKIGLLNAIEPIPALWGGPNHSDMRHLVPSADRSGFSESVMKSVLAVFDARNQRIQSLSRMAGKIHANLLQSTAEEVKKRVLLLSELVNDKASNPHHEPPLSDTRESLNHGVTSSKSFQHSEDGKRENDGSSLFLHHANAIEQTKMFILLLSNLYRSIAAVIL